MATNKVKKSPYSHLFRIAHWVLAITMLFMMYSGFAIHSIARPEWSLFNKFPTWFIGGRIVLWHIATGVLFGAFIIISTIEFFKRKIKRSLKNIRWLANYLLLYGSIGSSITALGLLYSGIPDSLYFTIRFIHALSGMVILPLSLILHMYLGFTKFRKLLIPVYSLWREPKWKSAIFYIPILVIICFVIITKIPVKYSNINKMTVKKIDKYNGAINDIKNMKWDDVSEFYLKLENGVGFNNGRTKVQLKAMHDNQYIYMNIKWSDAVNNSHYWPWEKTESGWKRLVTYAKDENVYYEDKIALIFPIGDNTALKLYGCAITCHNSPPLPYGTKQSDNKIDVWHWKACRTAPVGYVDDKYFYGHDLNLKDVGRIADPKIKGGYKYNLSADKKTPSHLPGSPDAISRGALIKSKSIPYTKALGDKYKVGDRIPGIVIELVIGDRGDVLCDSFYKDGYWHLYIRRSLDTESEYDVKFSPGQKYDFACVAFDHTGKRHAYNHDIFTLYLEK